MAKFGIIAAQKRISVLFLAGISPILWPELDVDKGQNGLLDSHQGR
jgi:hypothetical protein